MPKISKVKKGQAPSLLNADKANDLIKMVNGLLTSQAQDPLSLKVDGDGKINININLSPLEGYVVVNGLPAKRIFYIQTPDPES